MQRIFCPQAVWIAASILLILVATFPTVGAHWPAPLLANIPTPLEAWGSVTGAWGIWLTVKLKILNWPLSIASAVLYGVFFYQTHLYANMVLQLFYVVLSCLGWFWWAKGGKSGQEIPLTRLRMNLGFLMGLLIIPATFACYLFLKSANGEQPIWDGFTFVVSLMAQYLQSRKVLQNWHAWIFVDTIYVVLFAYEQFFLTTILYVLFTGIAVIGLREWQAELKKERA